MRLVVKRRILGEMSKYCTPELLSCVFGSIGTDNITVLAKAMDEEQYWDITDLLEFNDSDVLDILKVVYVFSKLTDTLNNIKYKGKLVPYSVLFRLLNRNEPNMVLCYWVHNEANEVVPVYDVGEIEIPKIMPPYTYTQLSNNLFQVEKWHKGKYVPMQEIYPTKELCQERVDELNDKLELD